MGIFVRVGGALSTSCSGTVDCSRCFSFEVRRFPNLCMREGTLRFIIVYCSDAFPDVVRQRKKAFIRRTVRLVTLRGEAALVCRGAFTAFTGASWYFLQNRRWASLRCDIWKSCSRASSLKRGRHRAGVRLAHHFTRLAPVAL